MTIFCNFKTTSNHLHPPQDENCDSNSRLVVDEDDNGKFRLERGKSEFSPQWSESLQQLQRAKQQQLLAYFKSKQLLLFAFTLQYILKVF